MLPVPYYNNNVTWKLVNIEFSLGEEPYDSVCGLLQQYSKLSIAQIHSHRASHGNTFAKVSLNSSLWMTRHGCREGNCMETGPNSATREGI